jgi:hypothetical protein
VATAGAAGVPLATAGVVELSLSPAATAEGRRSAAASPVDDQPDAPSDTKLELPLPRKLLLKHPGWGSDDTKTFEKDRGGEHTHTHTHTHIVHCLVR